MKMNNNNGKVMTKVASLCANLVYNKFCSAACYAASCYVYQPANVDTLELNSAQALLIALVYSAVTEDAAACLMLAELCSSCQQLRSGYLKVWLSEDFNFPPFDMNKGLLFLSDLLRKGNIQLQSHLVSILSLIAHRYKCTGLYFQSLDEEEDASLDSKLQNAVLHNKPGEIFCLGMKYLTLNKKNSMLLGDLLHTAVSMDSIESVTALVYLKADLEVRDSRGTTPLHQAVIQDNPRMVSLLLESGANAKRRYFRGDSLLHLAAVGGCNRSLEVLLDSGFDVDDTNYMGETSLFQAINTSNVTGVEILLKKGANPYIQTTDNTTPLETAFLSANINLIKSFLKRGVNFDFIPESGDSLLHSVARSGNKEVLELLLDAKPPLEVKNKAGCLPIHVAVNPSILETLIRSGCNINRKTKSSETILHLAVAKGCIDLVKVLIYLDASLDLKDSNGRTAITIAAENSRDDILNLLLEGGARPDIKNDAGISAIHCAAKVGSIECVKALLGAGVSVNTKASNGSTPAMFAAQNNKVEVIGILEEWGANLSAKDHSGYGLLHWAAHGGAVDVANWLFDHEIEANEKDNNMHTPLIIATKRNKFDVIELLKKRGCIETNK